MLIFYLSLLLCTLINALQNYKTTTLLKSRLLVYTATTTNTITNRKHRLYNRLVDDTLYDKKAWESGYTTCKKEVCEIISNELPLDLYGTYYRNGHSKFEAGNIVFVLLDIINASL